MLNFEECEIEEKTYKGPKRKPEMITQWCQSLGKERKSFKSNRFDKILLPLC